MKTEDRSGIAERTILTAMLCDKHVCARLSQAWCAEGLFRSRYANLIGNWCVSHFSKYGEAMGAKSEARFAEFSKLSQDAETVKLVESLLAGLSVDWVAAGEINPEYVLDIAQKHIDDVALERALSAAQAARARGDTAEARTILSKLTPCLVSGTQWTDAFLDEAAIDAAFAEATHPLIKLKGPLGQLFKNVFCRDSLIAFRAIAKAGKSFNLLELVYKAVQQGNRVAYFCLGDLSQAQIYQRLGQRVTKKPMEPGDYQIPTGFDTESPTPFPIMKTMHWDTHLTADESKAAGRAFIQAAGGSKDDVRCRLSVHASGELTVTSLRGMLQQWATEGFTADVVLLDYADLLGMLPNMTVRESLEATWQQLRAITQVFHCCGIAATQSDADGYDQDKLGMGNFNGTRTSNDAVSAMYGISASDEEAAMGLQRIYNIANRNNPDKRVVVTAGSRSVACPLMYSMFAADAPEGKEVKSKPKRKAKKS